MWYEVRDGVNSRGDFVDGPFACADCQVKMVFKLVPMS